MRGRVSEGVAGERGVRTLIRGMENCRRGEGGREREREPGLGEILRGLRAMAWVKPARVVCVYVCVYVRTRARCACMYTACARVAPRAGVRAYVRARKFSARVRMRARVHAREKSILAVRRVQIVDTSYEPVTPEVRASVNYYYREFRQSIIVKQFPPFPPPPLLSPFLLVSPFFSLSPFRRVTGKYVD